MRIPRLRQIFTALFKFDALTANDEAAIRRQAESIRGHTHWFPIAKKLAHGDLSESERETKEKDIKLQMGLFCDVCAAFGLKDMDILLDLCAANEADALGQPLVVRHGDRERCHYQDRSGASYETIRSTDWTQLAKEGALEQHRTFIDIVTVPAKSKTTFSGHFGHEAVLVVEGAVTFMFEGAPPEMLNKFDFLSFNSFLKHAVQNSADTDAVLIVARPMMARYYSSKMKGANKFSEAPGPALASHERSLASRETPKDQH